MDKLKDLGEITFGAGCYLSFPGRDNFDKYFIDRVIKKVVHKTGDGEEDFIIIDKEIESKRDIAKEIHKYAGDAGIESYIGQFELTGEEMPDVKVTDDIQDFTGMPESLADAVLLGESSRKLYSSLPAELKGKMTYEEFCSSVTQEKFDAYVASLIPPKKEEVKE